MALGTWLLLVVILLMPPASVAGLVVWARRLGRSESVPRCAVRVAYALVGLAGFTIGTGFVLGIAAALGGLSDESTGTSDRARRLAEGISEDLNCSALGLALAGLCAVWIMFWRRRIRKQPGRAAS
jgi:hypothetical protein